jgi:hypothetical protein
VLVSPVEIFEEWTLLETVPLRETITIRAVYERVSDGIAILPRSVQGGSKPVAYALGNTQPLRVIHGSHGWQCALPASQRATVRIVATTTRVTTPPVMFQTSWPSVFTETVPTRRMVEAPRLWMAPREAWTCPDDAEDLGVCVSHERVPGPVVMRVPAATSPKYSVSFAWFLTTLSLAWVTRSPTRRLERFAAGVGGLGVALALCLSLVGARLSSWGVAACVCVPLGVLVGAIAPATRTSRALGAFTLAIVPLVAMLKTSASNVLILTLAASVATLCTARMYAD